MIKASSSRPILILASLLLVAGCASAPAGSQPSGMRTVDVPVDSRGPVRGVGIEGADIVSMTDRMMRDLLATPAISGLAQAPRVIIDSEYFQNESSQRINKNAITDRLRVELNRAAQGRLLFVGRSYSGMVEHERALKREGVTDSGTRGSARAQAGADFRLGGRISSVDARDPRTGVIQRYNQIVFEMIDLEDGIITWSGIYEFQRASADDIIYR